MQRWAEVKQDIDVDVDVRGRMGGEMSIKIRYDMKNVRHMKDMNKQKRRKVKVKEGKENRSVLLSMRDCKDTRNKKT